jgi:hypothetical protein
VIYAVLFAAVAPVLLNVPRTAPWELQCTAAGGLAVSVQSLSCCVSNKRSTPIAIGARRSPSASDYTINVRKLSVLIFSEGEHLTHHLRPEFARISRRWEPRLASHYRAVRITTC